MAGLKKCVSCEKQAILNDSRCDRMSKAQIESVICVPCITENYSRYTPVKVKTRVSMELKTV